MNRDTSNNVIEKGDILWSWDATKGFEKLKVACSFVYNSLLATHKFTKIFIVKRDTSGHGIGTILMHEGRPLSSESFQMKRKNLLKPIYGNKMLATLHTIKKLCPYLIGRHFQERTNHEIIKYFLGQQLSSLEKQKC